MSALKGWKTLIVGFLLAVGPVSLNYLAGVDWTQFGFSPVIAFAISGVIMMALRYCTNTPVFKHNAVAAVAAMPDQELRKAGVVKILTASNSTGEALADLTPGNVVVPADQASSNARRHA